MAENTARTRVIVDGRVQGVWFRASTERVANQLGLTGWVRNRPDGSVEAVFEGAPAAVDAAVAWAHDGPERAHVDTIEVFHEAPEGLVDFRVR